MVLPGVLEEHATKSFHGEQPLEINMLSLVYTWWKRLQKHEVESSTRNFSHEFHLSKRGAVKKLNTNMVRPCCVEFDSGPLPIQIG